MSAVVPSPTIVHLSPHLQREEQLLVYRLLGISLLCCFDRIRPGGIPADLCRHFPQLHCTKQCLKSLFLSLRPFPSSQCMSKLDLGNHASCHIVAPKQSRIVRSGLKAKTGYKLGCNYLSTDATACHFGRTPRWLHTFPAPYNPPSSFHSAVVDVQACGQCRYSCLTSQMYNMRLYATIVGTASLRMHLLLPI